MQNKRPNFIFFITDQQRADWLGCYGHPVLKTPHIDALAANGSLFSNCHVASPVCMPNRASLMTGRFPSLHGLRYNGCTLPLRANTFVEILAAGGYKTAAIGKSHLQPFLDTASMDNTRQQAGDIPEAWKPETGDYGQEQPIRYETDVRQAFKTPYYGFQHVDMVTGHGDRCGGHYRQWFRHHVPNWQELHDRNNELPHNYSCLQAYRTPIPEELYPTTYIQKQTQQYLHNTRSSDPPFFLFVSFPDPHHPFNPPGRYWDMYNPEQFEVTLPFKAHKNPTPPMQYLEKEWKHRSATSAPVTTAVMQTNQQIKEAMALTAGMTAMIDDSVGAIVSTLKQVGLYDDTVLCFTTDHGDYLGDFNMLLKGAMPFRSITRVPLIWSDPQSRKAEKNQNLVSTIDIAATIIERANLKPYHGMQGRSFLTKINTTPPIHEELLVEYNDGLPRLGFRTPARVRTLLTDRYRFSVYKDQIWGEMYDLQEDPHETHNLWAETNLLALKYGLMSRLNQQMIAQMDESPGGRYLA